MFLRLLPIIFSGLLISAHFMRAYGNLIGSLFLIFLFLLFIKQWWVLRFWQIYLAFSAIIWTITTFNLFQMRIEMQEPWIRLALILGSVILITIFSLFWMENKKIKNHYYQSKLDE